MTMTQTLLTTAEVARKLRLHPRSVARRAASGELPYVQKLPGVTGGYLFDAAVIARLVATGPRTSLKEAIAGIGN